MNIKIICQEDDKIQFIVKHSKKNKMLIIKNKEYALIVKTDIQCRQFLEKRLRDKFIHFRHHRQEMILYCSFEISIRKIFLCKIQKNYRYLNI